MKTAQNNTCKKFKDFDTDLVDTAKSVKTLSQLAKFLNECPENIVFLHAICKETGWTVSKKSDRICYDSKNNLEIAYINEVYKVFETKDTIDSIEDVKRIIELYMQSYTNQNESPTFKIDEKNILKYFERWYHTSPVFECDVRELFSLKKGDFNLFIANKIAKK